jgi:hypothetical protein
MKYLNSGATWLPSPDADLPVHDELPVGFYAVCYDKMNDRYYFQAAEPFKVPSKLYGRVEQQADRILATFVAREDQTGVLLSGLKGSGKTLLSKVLGLRAGVPVILVNTAYHDDKFLRLIQGIPQRAVIIFDEFEKVYDEEQQNAILTLFDGVYTAQRKLIVLTVNNRHAVNAHFHNRPGRLRYAIEFRGLEPEFIREYCADHLRVPHLGAEDIVSFSTLCIEFNFDMLQTLVDEINRYGGTLEEASQVLNVKPVSTPKETWAITIEAPDEPKVQVLTENNWTQSPMVVLGARGNPYGSYLSLDAKLKGTLRDGTSVSGEVELTFAAQALVKVDAYKNLYVFATQTYLDEDDELRERRTHRPIRLHVTFAKVDESPVGIFERYAC